MPVSIRSYEFRGEHTIEFGDVYHSLDRLASQNRDELRSLEVCCSHTQQNPIESGSRCFSMHLELVNGTISIEEAASIEQVVSTRVGVRDRGLDFAVVSERSKLDCQRCVSLEEINSCAMSKGQPGAGNEKRISHNVERVTVQMSDKPCQRAVVE